MPARRFRLLFVLDAVTLFGTMTAINLVRFGLDWPTYPLSHYVVGFSIATVIHIAIGYLGGLYEREPLIGQRPWLPRVTLVTAIGVATDGVAYVLLDRYLMPRLNLAALAVVGSLVLTANRAASQALYRRRHGPSRVALVGTADAVAAARRQIDAAAGAAGPRPASVVCSTADTSDLAAVVDEHAVTDVLLLDVEAFGQIFPEPLATLEARGVGFLQRVGAHETLLGLRSVREVAGMPFVRLRTHSLAAHEHRLKRFFDLVVLAIGLPVVVVVGALVALYVRMRAGAPVLYRQTRTGRDGQPFELVKFRTMRPDAESGSGAVLASADDPRVVPGLGWLRSTRLDEVPQLWNVLRGEMSLVGPRPERPEFTAELDRSVPGYARRYELPPGLTGLAQVQGRYDTDAVFKLGYDLQYLVNWSPALDLQILLRTLWVVIGRRV